MEQPGSEPHERITRKNVEEAEKQAEASYIKLMDDWEASVPDNGQFFIEVGTKANQDGSTIDTRALILKEGRPTQSRLDRELNAAITGDASVNPKVLDIPDFLRRQKPSVTPPSEPEKQYIAMTRNGPKVITFFGGDFEKLSRLETNGKGGFSETSRTIRWGESASHYTDLPNDDAGDKFFNEALTKSIEISRESSENAKNKQALDAAEQEQIRAQRLSGLSGKIINPPTSEGPTSPPPSPTA